jgi:hypothetical protein
VYDKRVVVSQEKPDILLSKMSLKLPFWMGKYRNFSLCQETKKSGLVFIAF